MIHLQGRDIEPFKLVQIEESRILCLQHMERVRRERANSVENLVAGRTTPKDIWSQSQQSE